MKRELEMSLSESSFSDPPGAKKKAVEPAPEQEVADDYSLRSNVIPPQSFKPLSEYVDELLETDDNEGRVDDDGNK